MSWLLGVYYGKLVVVPDNYEFARESQRERPYWPLAFGTDAGRFYPRPYFFFLKPAKDAKLAKYFCSGKERSGFNPNKYGLKNIAYEALGENVKLLARGEIKKDGFLVKNVPSTTLSKIKACGENMCVLSLLSEKTGMHVRTGTFFEYTIKDDTILFEPLVHDNGHYLVGKGILVGAWSQGTLWQQDAIAWAGGMIAREYVKERYCPLNVGSATFTRNKIAFYVTYRSVKTDIRMDLPSTYIFLKEEDGFRRFAENLGKDMNDTFGKCLGGIDSRNVLADGRIVDYADINTEDGIEFDITKCWEGPLRDIAWDVAILLYTCALASSCGKKGLETFINLKTYEKEEEFVNTHFDRVNEPYQKFCTELMSKLDETNREYFNSFKPYQSLYDDKIETLRKRKKNIPAYLYEKTGISNFRFFIL